MIRKISVLLTSVFMASAVFALDDNISNFTLDNGMDVYVIEDHRAPIVSHLVYYRVGSADEEPGKTGLAHYLEHLLFKGTDKMEAGEFSAIIAENGGSENAFTSQDYTGYYQRVAADRLDLMMELEADRMVNLKLTEEEVVPELAVVLEERRSRTDTNPNALMGEQRYAAQYMNHPYGRPIIGWPQEVSKLTREDAVAFYKKYYAPNNAILIVAGDVTPEEVREMANRHYGPIPAGEIAERVRPSEPPQLAPRRLVYKDARARQPYAIRTYLAPERDSGNQTKPAAIRILAELLGGSPITSHFARELIFDKKMAISTSAFYNGVSYDDTTFGVFIVPAEGVSLQEAEDAMDASIQSFIDSEIDVNQLDRIKAEIRAAQIYGMDDLFNRARGLGRALTGGLTLADYRSWADELQAVTPEQVKEVAQEVFVLNNSVTAWMVPDQEAQK